MSVVLGCARWCADGGGLESATAASKGWGRRSLLVYGLLVIKRSFESFLWSRGLSAVF